MKLTYWTAPCLNDSDAYSLRYKTRKEAVQKLRECIAENDGDACDAGLGPVRRVTIEYRDAFDLLLECSDESRMWWETSAIECPQCEICLNYCTRAYGALIVRQKDYPD